MTLPTPPIEWGAEAGELSEVLDGLRVAVPDSLRQALADTGAEVDVASTTLAEASRDWWPLAQRWALEGKTPAMPAVVVRPSDAAQVSAVLRLANDAHVPVTAAAGRSGVCGSSVPVFGGIALDCCGLAQLPEASEVDDESLLVTVGAGTFGPDLEARLRADHLTVGHFPQSWDLATVGGWIACRGAGQYSTRYGKIEDITAGLEVVLADGRVVRTGAAAGAGPRSAMGPDLTQIFVGSEGTLGVITSATLRVRPVAGFERRSAWGFASFQKGLEALRQTLRAGATPAVVRLYDERESGRTFERPDTNILIALDEGTELIVDAAMGELESACVALGGERLEDDLVGLWLDHRNDVSALASVTRAGIVVDTIEVAAPWSELPGLYGDAIARLRAVEGCLNASAHESHAYLDGACLYFTFAGRGTDATDTAWAQQYYNASWAAVMSATRAHGGSISHHHGIGIVRGRYLREALGDGFAVLEALKATLDPNGILNPGKLGLASPFGPPAVTPA